MAGVKRQSRFRQVPCFSPKALQASIKMKRELWLASNAQLVLPLYSWERNQERGGAALRRIDAYLRAWCRFQDPKRKPVVAVWVAAAASDELTSAHLALWTIVYVNSSWTDDHHHRCCMKSHTSSLIGEGCAPLVHGVQLVFFSHTALSPRCTTSSVMLLFNLVSSPQCSDLSAFIGSGFCRALL